MLSAWFRFKYPNSVDGALAASAPIYIVANLTSPYAFFGLVTQVGEREKGRTLNCLYVCMHPAKHPDEWGYPSLGTHTRSVCVRFCGFLSGF